MVKHMSTSRVKIRSVPCPNKRRQMVLTLPDIQTDITVFADDDVLWPPKLLPWMLAPLEDESYGGVGTNQRLRRAEAPTLQQRVYGYLNALYLERRNFDCASCMYMDGGLPCLSGRTVAYRSNILKDKAFIDGFTGEEWLGRYRLSADDDNFITRWLVSHDQKIGFQYHKEAEVLTTLEDSFNLVKQCLRWSRSNWRSNITSMFCERHIWRLAADPPKIRAQLVVNAQRKLMSKAESSHGARTPSIKPRCCSGPFSVIACFCISITQARSVGVTTHRCWASACS